MATQWRVYGRDTVACKLNRADLPGFFRKQIVVGPHEAALVVKNGKAEEVVTEKRMTVTAGLLDSLARVFGGGTDVEVFFVDLGPIDFSIYLGTSMQESVVTGGKAAAEATKFSGLKTEQLISACKNTGWIEHDEAAGEYAAGTAERRDVSKMSIVALTLDHEVISAECLFRVRVNIEEAQAFTSLVKGKLAMSRWDLAALIRDELLARVLVPEVASHRSDELRGNRALIQKIEQDVSTQLQRTFALVGLTLESFAINWGLTEQEAFEIDRKRQGREEEALKFTHGRRLAEMQREMEIQRTRIENLQQLKQAEAQGNEQLKDLLLAGEVKRELVTEGKKVDVAKLDAQVAVIRLDVERLTAQFALQKRRDEETLRLDVQDREFKQQQAVKTADLDLQDKELRSMVQMQIQMATSKHEREMAAARQKADTDYRTLQAQIDSQFQQRRTKLEEDLARMGMTERLMAQALGTGAANADVLKTMLEQSTEQAYSTTSDEKVKARSEAQAAKANIDTFKSAEDRERQQQRAMTGLSSDMMNSAKQAPPNTVIAGGGMGLGGTPNVNVVNVPGQPAGAAPAGAVKCPGCGQDVQPGWKACPLCGRNLAPATCAKCKAILQPGWKVCPQCGQPTAG